MWSACVPLDEATLPNHGAHTHHGRRGNLRAEGSDEDQRVYSQNLSSRTVTLEHGEPGFYFWVDIYFKVPVSMIVIGWPGDQASYAWVSCCSKLNPQILHNFNHLIIQIGKPWVQIFNHRGTYTLPNCGAMSQRSPKMYRNSRL